jgi:hypothetical protein
MPNRVKCLHVLVAHSLAAGPGVNPFGDQALAESATCWLPPCALTPMGQHERSGGNGYLGREYAGCGCRLRNQFGASLGR